MLFNFEVTSRCYFFYARAVKMRKLGRLARDPPISCRLASSTRAIEDPDPQHKMYAYGGWAAQCDSINTRTTSISVHARAKQRKLSVRGVKL